MNDAAEALIFSCVGHPAAHRCDRPEGHDPRVLCSTLARLDNPAWPRLVKFSTEFILQGAGEVIFDGQILSIRVSNGWANYRIINRRLTLGNYASGVLLGELEASEGPTEGVWARDPEEEE